MEKYLSATLQATVLLAMFAAAFFITATVYLYRLIWGLIWQKEGAGNYGSLWILPYGLILLLGINPPGTFNLHLLKICLFFWTCALACAIIQSKVISGLTWHVWGETQMMKMILACQKIRKVLVWVKEKWWSLSALARKLIFGVCIIVAVLAVHWAPDMLIPFSVPLVLFFLVTHLWLGLSSCRNLLGIWFGEGIIYAVCGATAIYDILPNQIVNEPIAYAVFSVIFTLAWTVSAGVADYDVAKMACHIINTITTIALVFVNIFFFWIARTMDILTVLDFPAEELIYGFNLILFPLVAAGYIADLFVEGQQYILKRMEKNEPGSEP